MLARIAVAAVVLLAPTTTCGVAGHSRALRPGGGRGQQQPSSLFPANATRAEAIERQFVEWVRYVGGLRHSTFQHAVARASPSYSLVVDKDPALGDFTTIQAAVDSLPAINLVRVVIRVNAGTYADVVHLHCVTGAASEIDCLFFLLGLLTYSVLQGEGEHLADARVRHRGGRRRRQDGGAVGRHGGHGRVLGQAHGHVRLRHVRRQLHVLRGQEHHLQGSFSRRGVSASLRESLHCTALHA